MYVKFRVSFADLSFRLEEDKKYLMTVLFFLPHYFFLIKLQELV